MFVFQDRKALMQITRDGSAYSGFFCGYRLKWSRNLGPTSLPGFGVGGGVEVIRIKIQDN